MYQRVHHNSTFSLQTSGTFKILVISLIIASVSRQGNVCKLLGDSHTTRAGELRERVLQSLVYFATEKTALSNSSIV